ncbi:MAG: RNA-binding protein [Hyphomicrobium sp.]
MAAKRQQRSDDGGGPNAGPERQCAVTRAGLPPHRLIRFALAPDGAIVPDVDARLPGRGVWVTADRETVAKAVATKAFARSLKQPVSVAANLADLVEALLLRRVSDGLSLANKAGLAVAGFQQVDAALEKGGVAALLHGRDAAADGRGKLDRKFQAIQRERGAESPIVDILTIAQISLAMGRTSVVHAALIPGGLTDRFLTAAGRFKRYRVASAVPGHVNSQPNPSEG